MNWIKEVSDQEYNGDFWLFMKIVNGDLEWVINVGFVAVSLTT